jgi:hypothetical protein
VGDATQMPSAPVVIPAAIFKCSGTSPCVWFGGGGKRRRSGDGAAGVHGRSLF